VADKRLLPHKEQMQDSPLPLYEPPQVITYTQDEILEELGPAQALYGNGPGLNA
jgi:hypothetical protein